MPANEAGLASQRARAQAKDIGDGVRRCAYGECFATLEGRPASRLYCTDQHAKLAKVRRTLEGRAEQAARQVIDAASDPGLPTITPDYRGWLVTQASAVLSGQDVLELRSLLTQDLGQISKLRNLAQGLNGSQRTEAQAIIQRIGGDLAALMALLPEGQTRPTRTAPTTSRPRSPRASR